MIKLNQIIVRTLHDTKGMNHDHTLAVFSSVIQYHAETAVQTDDTANTTSKKVPILPYIKHLTRANVEFQIDWQILG